MEEETRTRYRKKVKKGSEVKEKKETVKEKVKTEEEKEEQEIKEIRQSYIAEKESVDNHTANS